MHSGYKLLVTFGAERRRSLGNVCNDFTFKEKQLTAIKSVIENKDTIDLFVYKHFLSSSFFQRQKSPAVYCHGNHKNTQFNTKVNNNLLRLNPNNPVVILRFATLTPGRLSR
jgi:hypothetical protein